MKRLCAWLAAACVLLGMCAFAQAEETIITEEDIASAQAEVDALRAEIAAEEKRLDALERQYAYENRDRDIVFPQSEYILLGGAMMTLKPEITPLKDTAPAETKLLWETSDRSVARVDGLGRVTGVNPGVAEITCIATDNDQIYMSVQVEVVQPVKKIEVEESVVTLVANQYMQESMQLYAAVTPADAYDASVTWTSEDESVVMAADGLLQAVGFGTTRVTVSANDGSGVRKVIRVHVVQGAEVISLDQNNLHGPLMNGDTLQLYADVGPRDTVNREVAWESDDESVATVTKNGLVRTVGPGACRIYARSTDGTDCSSSMEIVVIQPVEAIKTDTPVLYLKQDETAQPVCKVSPEKVSDDKLLFFSDNPAIAVVDANGVITPVDGGTCHVTVRANDGYGAAAVITVNVEPDVPLEITDMDVRYTTTGTPHVELTVRNCSFDTDVTGFTFEVECRDAYYGRLQMQDGNGTYKWSGKTICPDETLLLESSEYPMPGCEMVWQVKAWITSVTTEAGKTVPVPEEERIVYTWHKY